MSEWVPPVVETLCAQFATSFDSLVKEKEEKEKEKEKEENKIASL